MARLTKQSEPDEPAGAPEWMVTFSDCMTLLLTFFVLLLSFSSFDDVVFHKLKIIFAKALPSVSLDKRGDRDAFLFREMIKYLEDLESGSEKPTLATGSEDTAKEDTDPADFRRQKVFLVSSDKVFWGNGTVISRQGAKSLSTAAKFLKEVPSRIVISENGPDNENDSGLQRAWAVMKYFTTKQGLNKKRFSISGTSTLAEGNMQRTRMFSSGKRTERVVEITLLERSIYN